MAVNTGLHTHTEKEYYPGEGKRGVVKRVGEVLTKKEVSDKNESHNWQSQALGSPAGLKN